MDSEPPTAASKLKRKGGRALRKLERIADELYQQRGFDKTEFIGKAKRLLGKLEQKIEGASENTSVVSIAESVGTYVRAIDTIDGMIERDWRRKEIALRIMLEATNSERPTVTVLVGQVATSPAMRVLVGAEKKHVVTTSGEPAEARPEDADELPAPDRHG